MSKDIKLKYATSGSIRELVLSGKLRLPESIAVAFCGSNTKSFWITGEEKDIRAAERAIAEFDIQPHQVIVKFDITSDGKSISKPIVRTLVGYEARISEERLTENLKNLSVNVVPRKLDSSEIRLQAYISINDIGLMLPAGVISGDTFSYSATKAAYYLRWSRSGKTIAEYPVPESVKALGNTQVTISFETVYEP
jgi:hypothetical protein